MKNVLLICLLAVSRPLLAQDIDLTDLQLISRTENPDSIDRYILPKGYTVITRTSAAHPLRDNSWRFDAGIRHGISRITKTETGHYLQFETSDPVFYAHLLNQLPAAGFTYRNTIIGKSTIEVCFAGNREEVRVLMPAGPDPDTSIFSLVLQSATATSVSNMRGAAAFSRK